MRNKIILALGAVVISILAGARPADATTSLTLNPTTGAISDAAGSTIGWGFTFTNTANFAVITDTAFCVGGVITSPCTNSIGTYADIAGNESGLLIAGPSPESTSLTQSFNLGLQTGVGSFHINTGATGSVSGDVVVFYDLYSVDPNAAGFNPTLDLLTAGADVEAVASVTVTGGSTPTPEPGTLLLCGSGLLGLAAGFRRRISR